LVILGTLLYLAPVHQHADLFLVALDQNALPAHAPYHVKRLDGLAAQRQLGHVRRHVFFDRRLHLLANLEKPVRRAQPFQALMRPVVVVVLHPVRNAFLGFLERVEPGPHQELVLQRLPEPLDLS